MVVLQYQEGNLHKGDKSVEFFEQRELPPLCGLGGGGWFKILYL